MIKSIKKFTPVFLILISFAQCVSAISKDEAISFIKEKTDKTLKFAKEHKKKLIAAAAIGIPTVWGAFEINDKNKTSLQTSEKKLLHFSLSPLAGLILILEEINNGLSNQFFNLELKLGFIE